jgi:alginate O-acetyltransferase complex protein AlgI
MLFSTLPFVCLFLPTVVAAYFLLPATAHNAILVAASVLFYAWDDPLALIPIGTSTIVNFHVGRRLGQIEEHRRRPLIAAAIAGNLLVLTVYKYTAFIFENVNELLSVFTSWQLPHVRIPLALGISFFTFHVISYLVDVYRGTVRPQQSLTTFALYMLNFPQMIAGPIIRYHYIENQLEKRPSGLSDVDAGITRFVVGLVKKLVIADPIGAVADQLFAHQAEHLSAALAWTAAVSFGLQIYFDFSGYSDMAIGLARIFGFRFPENFNYPYAAVSIQDFWHRWHMTLSSWFRDYVYIPLGGNRFGAWSTARNLWLVFLLAGIWHGASWTFVAWGLWHGLFLAIERAKPVSALLERAGILRHLYVLLVVLIGWVFFRAESLGEALLMLRDMFGLSGQAGLDFPVSTVVSAPMALLMLLASAMSAPLWPAMKAAWPGLLGKADEGLPAAARAACVAAAMVAVLASMALAQQIPFLYFRF